ncbi:hypothetical protein CPC16_006908 [Podila verticillata]|uniref:Uncharacterized protein n=1 Tax=Podila verticillata NRRL 6337 TaxID=1069443 RepID=A0A086TIX3_9FUNG|nr:hypothetical protein BGZ52_005066 [Haplosporangium bisporale]KAF9216973.1 hypothetical protein BGZ59_007118 [Podila verticillata]KAF9387676.1 hypothetical protein CPC16_006908 [Podila verticillata]KFH61900.1 hypothetical protein MVEG_12234 [Podila verticillata NRRL 6337]
MHKVLFLLLALCASVALAASPFFADIRNNDGSKVFRFKVYGDNNRGCWCVKNTQTGSITGVNGGNIKLFSTSDCTGNYQTLGSNSKASNTQWVNSFSMGASGVSSSDPQGYCPNWYTIG